MSLESSNILLDPIPELETALKNNTWGITSGEVLIAESFPVTPEDKERVRSSVKGNVRSVGGEAERVVGKARIELLEGDSLVTVLDQRGFTLETATNTSGKTYPSSTFETLESLLIATSPLYVEAMTNEVGKRFEGYSAPDSSSHREDEQKMAEGGEQAVWR